MRRKIFTLCLGAILLLALAVSGCSKADEYVAKVNGQQISKKQYEERLKGVQTYLEKQGIDFSTDEGKAMLENIRNEVLEGMIGAELIRQEISKNSWDVNHPEVNEQIDNLKAQLVNKDYREWLKGQAMTEEDVRNYFTFTYFVGKDVTVTDQEIKQQFESNYDKYGGQPEQVKARHILVKTEEEAREIIKELQAGANFAKLAREKSIEPAAKTSGGDLGYFPRGRMVPEFEEAAFSQPVGVISPEPVKTKFGYHVILVEDHKQAVKPDFAKVKDQVREDALALARNLKVQSYYSKIRGEAKIEYAEGFKPDQG